MEKKLIEIEKKKIFPPCYVKIPLQYVDLVNGTPYEKMKRITEQILQYKLNILLTPQDSNLVRSSLVAELGEDGLKFWLTIRQFREDYDEETQRKRYNYMLKHRAKNTMTFGTIINRYKQAIDRYNDNNNLNT